eukprot:TRINITY_DN26656_c0_g1_i1.p1 TRINITY_DN26656_c0_g1~~TRINITY_DN26656_c0_g1_i1.p1  ORF type:complete len:398 (-),score=74.28 TRINITY_DN26656_c0_g1_i1:74-1222(-)
MALTKFRAYDFNQAYNEFDMGRAMRLGKGGFGKVYLVKHTNTGVWWAAKYQNNAVKRIKDMHKLEAQLLSELQNSESKHVPDFYKYYEKGHHTLLINEYLKGGELFEKINDKHFKLTEDKIIVYTRQMVEALIFIHQRHIVHMDMKPQNVMLVSKSNKDNRDTIKIIDFGLAKRLTRMRNSQWREIYGAKTGFSGTIGFMAPEVLKCSEAVAATDFFSLGAVVFMLVTGGCEPFWEKDDATGIKNTMKADPWRHFKDKRRLNVSENAINFVSELLQKRHERRLSGTAALAHPWLRTSDLHTLSQREVDKRGIRRYMARQRWKKLYKGVTFALKMQKMAGVSSSGGSMAQGYGRGHDRVDSGVIRTRVYETMQTVHIPIQLVD